MKASNTRQKIAAMSELEILKNTPRKRASTGAIREGEESRKKACGTIEKGAIHDEIAKVALEAYTYHQRRSQQDKTFIERKPRQRVRLLSYDQECCACEDKVRFRTNGVCDPCEHRRCVECLAR